MMIHIDNDYKCYTSPAEGRRAVETDSFDGKCRQYIEGYRFIPEGESWTREDGVIFHGVMMSPYKDYWLLEEFQAQYEEMLSEQADMRAALELLGVSE